MRLSPACRPPPPIPSPPTSSPTRAQVSAKAGDNVNEAFLGVVTSAAKLVKEEEPILPVTVDLAATAKPAARKEQCQC